MRVQETALVKAAFIASRAKGQSLTEALIGMVALAGLFVLIPVLGRYQDLSLQSMHAASGVAFATVRGAPDPARATAYPFQNANQRWTDRGGRAMLTLDGSGLGASVTVANDASANWQIGGQNAHARQLRQDWGLDAGIVTARVRVAPVAGTGASSGKPGNTSTSSNGLGTLWTGGITPPIHRRIAILAGVGHAGSDSAAQTTMASSRLAWSANATQSVQTGRSATSALQPLDAGWQRPAPNFDWLSPWLGLVPANAVDAR
ncbi:hypothetical protein FXN63_18365 [Pigmentiphaga aceris]|uniref:Pilus assembly protein n=1 Tax=Pigmentiphaga aceris TaxID=1940612 RepID=A0A5C0AYP9_9BURK|nr:hypothetical protein [Pigmentiphaga aceris]QEI07582.1 hypothetical protein FXN63_18365 [Pigmentiphaga aceris]